MPESAQFTALEHSEFEDYRPPNILAIVSLLIALVSAVALIHPLLSVVSGVAIVLAANALLPSRADAWGRPLALVALGFAVFFAAYGNTWYFHRRAVLFGEARKHGESWLKLMASEQYKPAHQLTLAHYERAGPEASIDDYYSDQHHDHDHDHNDDHQSSVTTAPQQALGSPGAGGLKSFLAKFPISKFVELRDFGWRFERVESFKKAGLGEKEFELRYMIVPAADSNVESFSILVVAARGVENNIAYWRISNIAGEWSADQ